MRIALVTTPVESRSGIGDYVRHLLPYLREHAEIDLFVEIGLEGEEESGERTRPVDQLRPREYDQILYQLGNEIQHAFMVPLVRGLGGTVMLHDWVLFDLALAAFPSLARGGLRGLRRAWTEGGLEEAAIYWRNKHGAVRESESGGGVFRSGWHVPEQPGRWCASRALLALPPAEELRLDLVDEFGEPGRSN